MTAEIEVGKQVAYALLSGPSAFWVSKQAGYAELAYPHIDIAKQVGYAALVDPKTQIAKQVVYALLKTYPPLDFTADIVGELTLSATITDPSARFQVDLVGEGLLGVDLARFPPFDCQPKEATTWVCQSRSAVTWNVATTTQAAWACADDEADTHNDALITLRGDFLVTKGGKHLRLITPPSAPPPSAPVNLTPPSILGVAAVGNTLTGDIGTWTGNP